MEHQRLSLTNNTEQYWQSVLSEYGHHFNQTQVRYLICTVLQHIYQQKEEGNLLSDTEMEDLAPEYIHNLMLIFADRVYKVTALAYPRP